MNVIVNGQQPGREIPGVVFLHIALCLVSLLIGLFRGLDSGEPAIFLLVLGAWNLVLLALYRVFLRSRKNWARWALAILTLPMGLLLMLPTASAYVGERH